MQIVLATQNARTGNMLRNALQTADVPAVSLQTVATPDEVQKLEPDNALAFVDWEGFPNGGMACVEAFRQGYPDLPIVVLSLKQNFIAVRPALQAGASGVVQKPIETRELVAAIARVRRSREAKSDFGTRVEEDPARDLAIVRVRGNLDPECRAEFRNALLGAIGGERSKIVVDLSQTPYIASLFFGTLVDAADQAREKGRSLSVLMTEKMARIAEQTGLGQLLKIVPVRAGTPRAGA